MAFNLQTWREQCKELLKGWKQRMAEHKIDSIYGIIAASAFWPVAAAFQQGDISALMELGKVLTGVGTNLLAGGLQSWRDQAEAARHLTTRLEHEPALREELDAIIAKLDAIALAKAELPEQERQWFVETLRQELMQLGNLPKFQATVYGSGAIAQGEVAVAAGAGGTAIVTMHGNVYLGQPSQDPNEALAIYCRVLVSACRHLPLRGVDIGASDPTGGQQRLDLAQVYVNLDTKTQVPLDKKVAEKLLRPGELIDRTTRPLGVLEATVQNRRLVILGDPGSGKSTFVNHLALCLAGQKLEPQAGWLDRLSGWPTNETELVPITVVLRDFARWLPVTAKKDEACHLWDFVLTRLKAQNLEFVAEALHSTLENGYALVLLDGLDEIPTKTQRALIRDLVAAFAKRYPQSRLVVTCRTLSYQDKAWQLAGFPSFELAPFDEKKIEHFIKAWYHELARLAVVKMEEATPSAERLLQAIRRADLWRLAPNPLLLTVMALVHTHKGRLPDARALLYEETVDILLWRWEQLKITSEEETPNLRQLLNEAGRTDVDLKRKLWQLAFEAHQQGKTADNEALADISEWQLEKKLAELHPEQSRDWARQVIEAMKLRAGLLLERVPEVYTFPHRTFQEYLAGAHLSTQAEFAKQVSRLMAEGALWREVVLLAIGRLVYLSGDTDKPLALVGELCPQQMMDNESAWRKAWLAGEVLVEMGLNRVEDTNLGRDLSQRSRQRLAELVTTGRLSPVERAAAGNALARLGDLREEVTTIDKMQFCFIPAGPFWMGDEDKSQKKTNCTLDYDYWLSRYPITNAQFGAFVQAGGYQEARYWPEAKAEKFWQKGKFKGRYDNEFRSQPHDFGAPFDLPNHPVVGITWYEALAFCRWLTESCRNKNWLDAKTSVQLPSEAEWEKAARGGEEIPESPLVAALDEIRTSASRKEQSKRNDKPARQYPWGDEPDSNRANYVDSKIGATSAVGCFHDGTSPYDCEDMSGNVLEWTRSLWESYPYPTDAKGRAKRENLQAPSNASRVWRGGAFYNYDRDVRCASRFRHLPYDWSNYLGFRVAVLPL